MDVVADSLRAVLCLSYAVAVVSVKGADAELDAGFDESDDVFALGFSVTHPASTMATRRALLRRVGSTGEGIGV